MQKKKSTGDAVETATKTKTAWRRYENWNDRVAHCSYLASVIESSPRVGSHAHFLFEVIRISNTPEPEPEWEALASTMTHRKALSWFGGALNPREAVDVASTFYAKVRENAPMLQPALAAACASQSMGDWLKQREDFEDFKTFEPIQDDLPDLDQSRYVLPSFDDDHGDDPGIDSPRAVPKAKPVASPKARVEREVADESVGLVQFAKREWGVVAGGILAVGGIIYASHLVSESRLRAAEATAAAAQPTTEQPLEAQGE